MSVFTKRNGKDYRRVGRPGPGTPPNARPDTTTARWDVFFNATRNGRTERLVRAWREITAERAVEELEVHYRKDYRVKVEFTESIEGSITN
jgi:hypothetical protein